MIGLLILFIALSAIFSGLTIGMFSLSIANLERKIRLGDEKAAKVLSIRKEGNFLLCTLLLGNVAVNSCITMIMTELSTGIVASAISTIIIFVFGEVAPQAIFSRFAFKVGYYTTWLVKGFMFIMWPIAKPMSILLDFILGKEFPETYNKNELRELIQEQGIQSIDSDEKRIVIGALKFSEKTASDVITPSSILYHLDKDEIITKEKLEEIKREHYSRIPIISNTRDNIVGILYAKDLIGYNLNDTRKVEDLMKKDHLYFIDEKTHLDVIINTFCSSKIHMAFVKNEFGILLGIVTLEDVIEEILAIEILDESDTVADLQHLARNRAKSSSKLELKTN